MIGRIKRALRNAIERRGYVVRPTSMFGVAMHADVRRLLRNRDQPVIVDVGANAGQWLGSIKRVFPDARVICYEPDERAFSELRKTASAFGDVECVRCALGAEAGRTQLFRNADSVTSSLLRTAPPDAELPYAEKLRPLDVVNVEVRTLDEELARLRIEHVDLLKTDCQGFDLRALEGGAGAIAGGDVDLIATEALFHREYEEQTWFHELLPWLTARSYALIGIYDALHDARGRMLFADALFARV